VNHKRIFGPIAVLAHIAILGSIGNAVVAIGIGKGPIETGKLWIESRLGDKEDPFIGNDTTIKIKYFETGHWSYNM